MTTEPIPLIHLVNITKTFPGGVLANDNVSLAVWPGVIHAIVGENGAGKTTLMNILYGRFPPDSGRIRLRGRDVHFTSPAQAIAAGIGMVTQHTTLIPAFSVLDNLILGAEPSLAGVVDRRRARQRLEEIAGQLSVRMDWNARAETLSVAALQKAEIIKALFRGAEILILDEPTATLAPQEAEALFTLLHSLQSAGRTILFITHKLREVMEHSQRVTVLRGGKNVGERLTSQTYPEDLLALMIGHRTTSPAVPLVPLSPETEEETPIGASPGNGWLETGAAPPAPWERGPLSEMRAPMPPDEKEMHIPPAPTLELKSVQVLNNRRAPAVRDFSLSVLPGEAVGVAGVDGSGQIELAEAIVGLRPISGGQILLEGDDISRLPVETRYRRGIGYIPPDRQREGLILAFTLAENLLLGRQRDRRFGGGGILQPERISRRGEEAIRQYGIRALAADVPVRALSGGNQQKVMVARALSTGPRLLVALQPTRGLDVYSTRAVYDALRAAKSLGLAILLFSLDLDEIFELSDRIAVIYNGTLVGILPRAQATPEAVGRLMVGAGRE